MCFRMGLWSSRCDYDNHSHQNERIREAQKQAEEYKKSGEELAREKVALEKQYYGYMMEQQARAHQQAMAVSSAHLAHRRSQGVQWVHLHPPGR